MKKPIVPCVSCGDCCRIAGVAGGGKGRIVYKVRGRTQHGGARVLAINSAKITHTLSAAAAKPGAELVRHIYGYVFRAQQ